MVIQQNAAISEETADTADDLLQQAEQLQKIIAFFHIAGTDQQTETAWEDFLNTLHTLSDHDLRDRIMTMIETSTSTSVSPEKNAPPAKQQITNTNTKKQKPYKKKEREHLKGDDFFTGSHSFLGDNIDQEFERH